MYQIIVDFDGTITLNDSTTEIVKTFLPEINKQYQQGLRDGTISIKQYIKEQVEMLTIDETEYKAILLKKIEIDPTFLDFFKRYPNCLIVSSGAHQHVYWVLKKHGVDITKEKIISNYLEFNQKKIQVKIHDNTSENAVNKSKIVLEQKSLGKKVIFIGDSYSDFDAAKVADVVFARKDKRLHKYCEMNNVRCYPYADFGDITRVIVKNLL